MGLSRAVCSSLAIAAATFVLPLEGTAQQLTRRQAIEDIRWVVRTLEESHPDPYSAFGGKVSFHRAVRNLLEGVPSSGMTIDGLYEHIAPFFGDLGDGHTRISPLPTPGDAPRRVLPIRFHVAADGLFVQRVAPGYENLLGSQVVTAEGLDLAALAERASRLAPVENRFGALRWAAEGLTRDRYHEQMFEKRLDSLRLTTLDLAGRESSHLLPYLDPTTLVFAPSLDSGDAAISWEILESANVGYLRLRSIEGREAFWEARHRRDLPGYVDRYYRRYLDREAPDNLEQALAGIPCFTGTVHALLSSMREKESQTLVVDVRGNGGGWSSLLLPLYLLTYGADYARYPFPETWVDVASQRFLQQSNWTLADLKETWGAEYEIGDYRFATSGTPIGERGWSEFVEGLERYGCGLAERVRELAGRPLHRPAVVVLLDSGTFSSAFHLVYKLWHLGAVLVGTPSAQAGNAFTNVTRDALPGSGLQLTIARSVQLLFPGDDQRGQVLNPDFPMGWSEFARYGFAPDAELRYALDLIAAERAIPRHRGESPASTQARRPAHDPRVGYPSRTPLSLGHPCDQNAGEPKP